MVTISPQHIVCAHGTHPCPLGSYHQPPNQQHSQSESITCQVPIRNQIDFPKT